MNLNNVNEHEEKIVLNSGFELEDPVVDNEEINEDDLNNEAFNSIIMATLDMNIGPDDYEDIEWPIFWKSDDEGGERETMADTLPEMAIIIENECVN